MDKSDKNKTRIYIFSWIINTNNLKIIYHSYNSKYFIFFKKKQKEHDVKQSIWQTTSRKKTKSKRLLSIWPNYGFAEWAGRRFWFARGFQSKKVTIQDTFLCSYKTLSIINIKTSNDFRQIEGIKCI